MTSNTTAAGWPGRRDNRGKLFGSESGAILIMTLLISSIMSMLILMQLELLWLHQQSSNQLIQRQERRQAMEEVAQHIMRHSPDEWLQACQIKGSPHPNEAIQYLKTHVNCAVKNKQISVKYCIEDLGVEPCQTITRQQHRYNPHHWRLTLSSKRVASEFLQIHFTTLAPLAHCKDRAMTMSQLGLLSWRLYGS